MLPRLSPMRCSVRALTKQEMRSTPIITQGSPSSRRRLCIMKITSLDFLKVMVGNPLGSLWREHINPKIDLVPAATPCFTKITPMVTILHMMTAHSTAWAAATA